MNPTFLTTAINDRLLNEVAHSTVSLEPVLFFYGGLIAAAAVLWMVGVVVFGRPGATKTTGQPTATLHRQRITPVVP